MFIDFDIMRILLLKVKTCKSNDKTYYYFITVDIEINTNARTRDKKGQLFKWTVFINPSNV